jgi:hypothetical protein
LSSLADCDIDQSVYAARKLVARLYDQKEKLKAGHVDLNKLRVRLATLAVLVCAQTSRCWSVTTLSIYAAGRLLRKWEALPNMHPSMLLT